jgi:hypothetical protein
MQEQRRGRRDGSRHDDIVAEARGVVKALVAVAQRPPGGGEAEAPERRARQRERGVGANGLPSTPAGIEMNERTSA